MMMTPFTLLTRPDGSPITKWQEWTRPKKDYHWKAGRSAMELAKSWFRDDALSPPHELLSLLHSHTRINQIVLTGGIPELVTPLPERGEGRNHDIALIGNTVSGETVTICIEAKADESFGNATVGEYWNSCIQKRIKGIPTRAPERVEALLAMVEPVYNTIETSPWKNIRYQLLTALCGTILQAKKDHSTLAILVVHEFQTNETSPAKQADNNKELSKLLGIMSSNGDGEDICLEVGKLYGPFRFGGMDCMVGKVISTLY